MRKSQVSKLAELPPSFSIEKYARTKDFSLAEWLVHIEMRVLCGYIISLRRKYSKPDFDPENFTLTIIDNPLYSTHSLEEPSRCSKKHVHHISVNDMTVHDYFFGGEEYQPEGFAKYISAFKQANEKPYIFDKELLDVPLWRAYENLGMNDLSDVFVRIDLHATEEKILGEFRQWLRNIRHEKGIQAPSRRIGDSDVSDWLSYGLLPYLDLTNWAEANDKVITQQVIGVALFPDEYEVNLAERIRKVVAPMARAVANESFTDAFRAQLLSEAAEQKTDQIIPGKFDCTIATDEGLSIRIPG